MPENKFDELYRAFCECDYSGADIHAVRNDVADLLQALRIEITIEVQRLYRMRRGNE